MCILAVARGCPSTALTLTMHTNVLGSFVAELGTPEQRRRYFAEAVEAGKFIRVDHQRARGVRQRAVRTVHHFHAPG